MNFSQEDINRFWKKVDIKSEDECWDWLAGLFKKGYGAFWLNGKNERAHRCSLVLAHAVQPLNKPLALHTCKQNPRCCNPNHLYYGDDPDNKRDIVKDGTQPTGENHGLSKLTEIQVSEIRQKYIPREYSSRKLAKEYKVVKSNILEIINNQSWKHI